MLRAAAGASPQMWPKSWPPIRVSTPAFPAAMAATLVPWPLLSRGER